VFLVSACNRLPMRRNTASPAIAASPVVSSPVAASAAVSETDPRHASAAVSETDSRHASAAVSETDPRHASAAVSETDPRHAQRIPGWDKGLSQKDSKMGICIERGTAAAVAHLRGSLMKNPKSHDS
jgi:hypothetical protein